MQAYSDEDRFSDDDDIGQLITIIETGDAD